MSKINFTRSVIIILFTILPAYGDAGSISNLLYGENTQPYVVTYGSVESDKSVAKVEHTEKKVNTSGLGYCFESASKSYGIPKGVLKSIARIESNNNPFTLNINGKGYYYKDKDKAMTMINSSLNKSFDIGIMQINKFWFKRYGYDYETGLDPCWNIHMGAYILAYEKKRFKGDISKAIAHYHSPKKKYQERYLKRVSNILFASK